MNKETLAIVKKILFNHWKETKGQYIFLDPKEQALISEEDFNRLYFWAKQSQK